MLANARNFTGRGTRPLRSKLQRELEQRRHVGPGETYLEVNPMLCACLDLLPAHPGPLNVIHLTRHPVSWVQSIRKFRASGIRRHLIDHVPFANPYPAPRPSGWLTMDRTKRALHRWTYCNQAIRDLANRCDSYTHIRYEDLFLHRDPASLERLLTALGLPTDGPIQDLVSGPAQNPAPSGERVEVPSAWVQALCEPLLTELGYAVGEDV
jgi:hypothetical protein